MAGSFGHFIVGYRDGTYEIHWSLRTGGGFTGSRVQSLSREVDRAGAERFSRKWGVPMPPPPGATDR